MVLNAQPASDVVIAVSSDNMEVSVSPARLTFSPSNWDTAQTVTVSAAQDADATNDAASITHAVDASRSAYEYDGVPNYVLPVTVVDDDTAGVTVSASALSVAEGHSVYYYVSLNTQPSSKVVIAVSSNNTDVTASPATLTFTPSDWRWLRRVRLDAAEDGDALNDMASITHAVVAASSADEYDGVTIAGVAVTVVDDEAAGIRVPVPGVGLYEGDSATYTVFLSARPTSDVVLTVTRSGSPYVTVSPATLTFTTANWSTAQTVTVRAAEDADAVRGRALLTHAVDASRSANEYDGVPNYVLPVTVTDDDNAGVTVSKSTLPLDEGTSATYTVFLSARPTSDVVITVSSDNSDVTVDRATLTFRPSNWDTAQTVTVSAAQDADAANDAASITHAVDASRSAYEYDGVPNYVLPVTVVDDETGVSVSVTELVVAEGGQAAYTVVLDALPSGNVVIGVTASGSPDVTVDRATLTFSPSNWDTAQTVTVSAAQDADAVNDAASITHAVDASRSADEYDGVPNGVLPRDRGRRRHRRGDRVQVHAAAGRGHQRRLHGGPGRAARLGRGDRNNHQRQPRRDGGPGHADLQPVQLGHGPDGDGVRRPGRRRGERRGFHHPRGGGRGKRRRVRRRGRGRGGGDRRRRRRRRGERVQPVRVDEGTSAAYTTVAEDQPRPR